MSGVDLVTSSFLINFIFSWYYRFHPPSKWVKNETDMSSKTSLGFAEKKEIYSTNCLVVFVHFVGLALKGWKSIQHEWSTFYTPCESLPQFVLVYKNWFFFPQETLIKPNSTKHSCCRCPNDQKLWNMVMNLRNRSK